MKDLFTPRPGPTNQGRNFYRGSIQLNIFTQRLANAMVRASILIDLVFSKTLIKKSPVNAGFFLRTRTHVPGRKFTFRVANAGSLPGPGS